MNILLTGCTRGIGFSIAKKLLETGNSVTGLVRAETKEISQLKQNYPRLKLINVDLADRHELQKVCENEIQNAYYQVLINNAGQSQRKPFLDISIDEWSTLFQVNLFSAVQLTKTILPKMLENKNGVIINMSSVGGQWGGVHQVHYAASKAAMINFTKSLTKSYAKDGIVSFGISPGSIDTEMITPELPNNEQDLTRFFKTIPSNRLGQPEEVADLVNFLVNQTPYYMTGHTFNINGGVYLG